MNNSTTLDYSKILSTFLETFTNFEDIKQIQFYVATNTQSSPGALISEYLIFVFQEETNKAIYRKMNIYERAAGKDLIIGNLLYTQDIVGELSTLDKNIQFENKTITWFYKSPLFVTS